MSEPDGEPLAKSGPAPSYTRARLDPTDREAFSGRFHSSQAKATGFLPALTGQKPYFQRPIGMDSTAKITLYLFPTRPARWIITITPKLKKVGKTWNLRYENIAGGPQSIRDAPYNYGGRFIRFTKRYVCRYERPKTGKGLHAQLC